MISAALAAGLALTMTVTAFADEPYTAYNYDYWDDAIPSQSAYRVEKTVTGADMGLDRLSDPSDPLYISDDAPAKLSDAKDLFTIRTTILSGCAIQATTEYSVLILILR